MADLNIELKKSKKKAKKNKEFIKIKEKREDEDVKNEVEEPSIADISGISANETPKKLKKAKKEGTSKGKTAFNPKKLHRGVVLIRGIPHGFYEPQLEQFFGQFGVVTRTRVARSKRTGNSKGFAYVEFRVPEVAKIAAETMDNYLMFKKRLRTVYISPKERKYNLFHSSIKYIEVDGKVQLTSDVIKRRDGIIHSYNKIITDEQHQKKIQHFESLITKAKTKYELISGVKVDPVIYKTVIQN